MGDNLKTVALIAGATIAIAGTAGAAASITPFATTGAAAGAATGAATGAAAGATQGVMANLTLGQIFTGISIAGATVASASSFAAGKAASKAEKIAAFERSEELKLKGQQERTQAALEASDRERRLRRSLAAQRAAFSGAGIDPNTGSPLTIQEQTIGNINRSQSRANLASGLAISNINRQALSELRAGRQSATSIRSKARTSLISDSIGIASDISDFRETL